LGDVKKLDLSLGLDIDNSWLIVVAKEEQDGSEILLKFAPTTFNPFNIHNSRSVTTVNTLSL